jgi:zinc protease
MNSFRFLPLSCGILFAGLLANAAHAQIAAKAVRSKIAGLDVIAYPTGVKNVVTMRGSFPAGDVFAGADNAAVPTLTGMLLDKGTTKNDRFAIAAQLERVGATIHFSVGNQMVEVSAKCLKKDMPLVVGLIAEQLRTPALSAEQLEKEKKQFAGTLQRQLEDTNFRARDAFTRALYPPGHPNRNVSPEEMLAAIGAAKLEEIVAFHRKHYGPAHFTLVATGDLDIPALQREIGRAFASWSGGVPLPNSPKATGTDSAKSQDIFMPGKTSVSVVLGHASGLRYSDPDYQAFRVATAILGSGFTGRLMANVRDKEGLTYGIGSSLSSDTFTDGDWRITATFAPTLLDKGIDSAKRQLTLWHERGVTADEVERRKTNLIGTFEVSLATSDGVASSLLSTVHRGYDLGWLDRYAPTLNALTPGEVNSAIKKYLRPDNLYLIKAGTMVGGEAAK